MRFRLRSPVGEYVSLAFLWLATRILPFLWFTDGRHCIWEVLQVEKLLQYGFWARKGAFLGPCMYFGILPNPADYNYVNHPYPIFWLYALLHWLTGQAGLLAIMALVGLAGCLLTYRFLKEFFPPTASWFTAALFVIAHANVEFDIDINSVAEGALLWPLAGMVIIWLRQANFRGVNAWLLGLLVFLAGQASWFALTMIPALMLLCLPEGTPLQSALRRPWAIVGWPQIVVGGTLSLLVFVGQIFVYSPSLSDNAEYLRLQMGVGTLLTARKIQLPVLTLRMMLAGPALWIGTIVGLLLLRKATLLQRRLLGTMLFYLAIFCVSILVIPRLVFLNQHAFRYTLFPCAVFTAFALSRLNFFWLKGALAGVGVLGLLLCYAKLYDYQSSTASVALGQWLSGQTSPQEVVLSNIRYLTPPIQSWDGEFANNVREMSDRLFFHEIGDSTAFYRTAQPFASHGQSICFVREASQPMDPEFASKLELNCVGTEKTNVVVQGRDVRFYKQARAGLWGKLKGLAPQYAPSTTTTISQTNTFVLTMYRLSPSAVKSFAN